MPRIQGFVRRIHIEENCVSTRTLEVRPLTLGNSIPLCEQALGMSPKPEIRCEIAHCSRFCTDAALPPQEVSFDMLLSYDSYTYTGKKRGMCLTHGATDEWPTNEGQSPRCYRHLNMRPRFGG
jgi:hypothetical protein